MTIATNQKNVNTYHTANCQIKLKPK